MLFYTLPFIIMGVLMVNSVKIESMLQKRIFYLRKCREQLLKIANSSFKGHYKFINSLVAV